MRVKELIIKTTGAYYGKERFEEADFIAF